VHLDRDVGCEDEERLQVLDVLGYALGLVAVGPGDDDVFRVAFVQPVPLLVAEDVEVEHVEDLEVALDRGCLALRCGRRREGPLGRGLGERRSGEPDRHQDGGGAQCVERKHG